MRKFFSKITIKTVAVFTAATLLCVFQAVGVDLIIVERIIAGIVLIALARYFKSAAIAVFIAFIIPLFYLPVGLEYGSPAPGYIAAVFETDPSETAEFLSIVPVRDFFYILVLIILLAFALFFNRGGITTVTSTPLRNRRGKIVALVLIIILLFFGSIPYRFYRLVYKSYAAYADLISKAETTPINDFEIIKRSDALEKDVRVVVIGESVRKDYLSVYGYPHKTTPFLDGANGIFIDTLIAAGPSTMTSLSRTLTAKENERIDWSRTVVTLGAQTGYETYWLSNSGFAGKTSTAVSLIASQSDRMIFLNARGGVEAGAKDDFEFLAKFDEILKNETLKNDRKTPKLIFIHMAGSHSPACNRLHGFANRFDLPYGKEHNCYLASIEKLDSFIKALVDEMSAQKLSWSLIYFSDHGQGHYENNKEIGLRHGGSAKQGYEVPLFLLDSAATEHVVIKRRISGLRLIDLFASWLGVNTDKTDPRYTFSDFPEDLNITTQNGAYDDLADDPALY
ncbi:MAG: lipid A phosphoethanolamine transferase [Helicobacteraceae bacterium]|jgi:glucan phosphoethanolaminetransferase (alkaline phosphatase superfamily)|nr:lipid A phosphoethanolamine transferase [Helicobacteraceae bacterium]